MRMSIYCLFSLGFICLLLGCDSVKENTNEASISWDEWQVPHISGNSLESAYYGFGYAQMKLHANSILKMYGSARAKAAEYWGESHLEDDILYLRLNIPGRSQVWYEDQSTDMKKYLHAFVKGMNAYSKEFPELINPVNTPVLPITVTDPLAHLQIIYHLNVCAFALMSQWPQWKNAGSNAIAVGPDKTRSGNAMLLIQPHPPWMDGYKFTEVHLQARHLNLYGIALVGQPMIAMGFNEDLGWGLTFNQVDAFDMFTIDIEGDQYVVGDNSYRVSTRTEEVKIRDGEGFKTTKIICKETIHGPVIDESEDHLLAVRIGGYDRPHMFEQFFRMGVAGNKGEFEEALQMMQLPLQNIVYADRGGEILYLYNGLIPVRTANTGIEWSGVLNGNDPNAVFGKYYSFDQLPRFSNPPSGFVSNSNNSPWTSTYPQVILQDSFPYIEVPGILDFRSQGSLRFLHESELIDFTDLETLQGSTHSEAADHCLDELILHAEQSRDPDLRSAARILKQWDRSMNSESKGAVLFGHWFQENKNAVFDTAWSTTDFFGTPSVLSDQAKKSFEETVKTLKNLYGRLDMAWGEVYKIEFDGQNYPSNVGLGDLGAFHAGFYRPGNEDSFVLLGGPAYTFLVEFTHPLLAKGLLTYGNSSENPDSGQLQLMISGKLRKIHFKLDEKDIEEIDIL